MSNKDSPQEYLVSVRSESPIPHDVLIEHIAVALRDFAFAGKVDVKMAHPFDNPDNVVFDDEPKLEEYTGTHSEGGFLPADPYPTLTRALDSLKGIIRARG